MLEAFHVRDLSYDLRLQLRHSQHLPVLILSQLSQLLHHRALDPSLGTGLDVLVSGGPVENVPVGLVQQLVVLLQLLSGHVLEIQLGVPRQQQVCLENASLSALVQQTGSLGLGLLAVSGDGLDLDIDLVSGLARHRVDVGLGACSDERGRERSGRSH